MTSDNLRIIALDIITIGVDGFQVDDAGGALLQVTLVSTRYRAKDPPISLRLVLPDKPC